jgi:hypothetical protein
MFYDASVLTFKVMGLPVMVVSLPDTVLGLPVIPF